MYQHIDCELPITIDNNVYIRYIAKQNINMEMNYSSFSLTVEKY